MDPRSPSASNSPRPRLASHQPFSSKVCFIACAEIENGESGYLDFYVFDLEQKPKEDDADADLDPIRMKPVLRLDNTYNTDVCLLNSEIYVFVSSLYKSSEPVKSVRSYNLWGAGKCGSTLDMNGFKRAARAIATPDRRKMLVFSTKIIIGDPRPGFIDFELFDSITQKFEELPALMPENFPVIFYIESYGFLDDEGSTFIIQIDDERHTMFSLDLVSPPTDRGWVVYGYGGGRKGYLFFVVGRSLRFSCSADAAYSFPKDELVYKVPGPRTARPRRWFCQGNQRLTTFLDEGKCRGDEGHRLCVLEMNYDPSPWDAPYGQQPILWHPRVHIAVYELKVPNCCGQERRPEAPAALLRKFVLDLDVYLTFLPMCLYPLSD